MLACLIITLKTVSAQQEAGGKASISTPSDASSLPSLSSEFESLLTRYHFENDGTGQKEVIARIRILNATGTLEHAEEVFEYRPLTEELHISYVRVTKKDGTVENVETNVAQPVPLTVTADSDLDERRVKILGLGVGDRVEYDVVTVIHRPLGLGEFCVQHSFQPSGVLDEQLQVDVPMNREVRLKTIVNVKGWNSVKGARRVYYWENQNPNAALSVAIPYVPGRTPDVQVSSFRSWADVGSWYLALEKNHRVPTAEIKAKAAELTKGSKSDLEKAESLYDFAAKQIKYTSLASFGISGSEPRSASETLHNGYGDCKDKTALLEALLDAEGIRASSVLISADRKLDPDFPTPWPFDHVIAALRVGSDEIWVDPSSAVLPFRMLTYPLRRKKALLVSSDRVPYLEETPGEVPVPNTWAEEIEGKVAENGTLEATVKVTARGDAELPLRQAFLSLAESMRPRGVQGTVMGIDRSDKVNDVRINDPTATAEPFILLFHLTKPSFIRVWEKESSAKLPLSDCRIDALGGYPRTGWDNGDSNARLGPPRECDYKIKLEFAPRFKVDPPAPIELQSDYAAYSETYTLEDNVLTAKRSLTSYMDELPSQLTGEYKAFEQQVSKDPGLTVTRAGRFCYGQCSSSR